MSRHLPPSIVVLLVALLAAGCGTADDREQARTITETFYDAVRSGDGETACAQLTQSTFEALESQSGQPCPSVVTRLDYAGGAITDVEIYLVNGKADLSGGESAFLSRESSGWKLSALACKPEKGDPREQPMECEVEA